jgi:hypothetical protein
LNQLEWFNREIDENKVLFDDESSPGDSENINYSCMFALICGEPTIFVTKTTGMLENI